LFLFETIREGFGEVDCEGAELSGGFDGYFSGFVPGASSGEGEGGGTERGLGKEDEGSGVLRGWDLMLVTIVLGGILEEGSPNVSVLKRTR
jgi:hypothetical protein